MGAVATGGTVVVISAEAVVGFLSAVGGLIMAAIGMDELKKAQEREARKKAEEAAKKAQELEDKAKAESKEKVEPCPTCGSGGKKSDEKKGDKDDKVPQKAKDTAEHVEKNNGEPPEGYEGGREFKNREGKLPDGEYKEYDVDPKVSGQSRNAERIVRDQNTGQRYYTPDHYDTFIPF